MRAQMAYATADGTEGETEVLGDAACLLSALPRTMEGAA
jgi:hypothetical protein